MNQIRIYYGNNDYRDYLAHHGVLGQRKGVRHGPPYPLDYEDHSAAEKRGMAEKGVKYRGIEGSIKIKKKSLKERFAESKAKRIEAKKAKLAKEAIKGGNAVNVNNNRDLFTPQELKDIAKKMDEQAEANRAIKYRSSELSIKAEKRQNLLEKGDAKKILKNIDQYTMQEINDAAAKIAARQKLTEAIRNERLKAIESYVQKGASITKSIGDIANNLSNVKTAYDKITGADKPSSAIREILNSGDPQKILGAINSGLVSAKDGKDALEQARTKVALQKMIDNPGTDGTGNGIRQNQNDGKKKDKNPDKNQNAEQPAQETKEKPPKQEEKKSSASSVMDMIPESFKQDAARRAEAYKEQKASMDAQEKARKQEAENAKKAAKKQEKAIKKAGGEVEYLEKQAAKQRKQEIKTEKKAAEARDEQNRKIKSSLETQLSKYATANPSLQSKVQKGIRALQSGETINKLQKESQEKQKLRSIADAWTAQHLSEQRSQSSPTKQSGSATKKRSESVERHIQAMSKAKSSSQSSGSTSSTGPLTLSPKQTSSLSQVKSGAEKLSKAASKSKETVDRIISNLDDADPNNFPEPTPRKKKRR